MPAVSHVGFICERARDCVKRTGEKNKMSDAFIKLS